MSDQFHGLEREDVVSVYGGQVLVNNRTFTVAELISAIMPIVKAQGSGWTEEKEKWFGDGIDCKILKPGAKKWQRGKVRFTLEFTPEDLDVVATSGNSQGRGNTADSSPLDDIRQKIPRDS